MRTGGEGGLDGGAVAAPAEVAVAVAVPVVGEDENDGWLVAEVVDGEGGVEVMLDGL